MAYSESKCSTANKSINLKQENYIINNQIALNLIEAIVGAKCNTIIATIVTDNGSVYKNITVDTFDVEGVLFNETHYITYNSIVEINVRNVPE